MVQETLKKGRGRRKRERETGKKNRGTLGEVEIVAQRVL